MARLWYAARGQKKERGMHRIMVCTATDLLALLSQALSRNVTASM